MALTAAEKAEAKRIADEAKAEQKRLAEEAAAEAKRLEEELKAKGKEYVGYGALMKTAKESNGFDPPRVEFSGRKFDIKFSTSKKTDFPSAILEVDGDIKDPKSVPASWRRDMGWARSIELKHPGLLTVLENGNVIVNSDGWLCNGSKVDDFTFYKA